MTDTDIDAILDRRLAERVAAAKTRAASRKQRRGELAETRAAGLVTRRYQRMARVTSSNRVPPERRSGTQKGDG